MEEDDYYQKIKQAYPQSKTDYDKLFQTILSVAEKIGLEKTLEMVSRRGTERRDFWVKNSMERTGSDDVFDDVLKVFYEDCIGVDIRTQGKLVDRTEKRLVTKWNNYCPILEACKKYGLDTKVVCKIGFHNQNQFTISSINPKLKFDRNYDGCLRPRQEYCEEIITLED